MGSNLVDALYYDDSPDILDIVSHSCAIYQHYNNVFLVWRHCAIKQVVFYEYRTRKFLFFLITFFYLKIKYHKVSITTTAFFLIYIVITLQWTSRSYYFYRINIVSHHFPEINFLVSSLQFRKCSTSRSAHSPSKHDYIVYQNMATHGMTTCLTINVLRYTLYTTQHDWCLAPDHLIRLPRCFLHNIT